MSLLRSFLQDSYSDIAILESADDVAEMAAPTAMLSAGLLIQLDGGYATVSAQVTEPPITSGEAKCQPGFEGSCLLRPLKSGTAVVYHNTLTGASVVNWYRPNGDLPIYVHSSELVTEQESLFWTGGAAALRAPLTVDEAVALAEKISATL